MKRKPWPLIIIALLHVLSPIGNIIANSFLAKISILLYIKALLTPNELLRTTIFLLIPVVGGFLIYLCKKWSYYLYLLIMIIPFLYSYYSWQSQPNQNLGIYLISFYLINIIVVGYFVLPQVRVVYFDPRLRWWETKPRYAAEFETEVKWIDQKTKGEIKNISESGIFLQTSLELNQNARVEISFKFNNHLHHFLGEVIYTNANVTPKGYGLSLALNEKDSEDLRKLIRDLSEQGSLITSRAPSVEDSFGFWLSRLIHFKKGLLPESGKKTNKPV